MKDIKLTIEDKVKCVELFRPEGFDIQGQPKDLYYGSYRVINTSLAIKKAIDPLFLQRVLEGINNKFSYSDKRSKNGYHIRYSTDSICVMNYTDMEIVYSSDEDFSIDQAKTQAIKYILDKLK